MEKAVADEVASADVLWYAAERIGKSSSGDEIQKICDYLVNTFPMNVNSKHWFRTAGDLRIAQLATEEWHLLQIPSRLKIAVQQVLDETPYQQQQYHQEQAGSSDGYAEYYNYATAQDGEQQSSAYQHQSGWPVDGSSPADTSAAAGYEAYYYAQETAMPTADGEQHAQHEQYSTPVTAGYYDYTTEATEYTDAQDHTAEHEYPPPGYYDQVATTTEVVAPDQTTVESYYHHRVEHEATASRIENEIVEAHAVVVEDAITYEEILAPMPQQWGCRQCTFLNPISESFCEMCQDHISASPDMAGVTFPGAIALAPASAMKPEQVMQPAYSGSGYTQHNRGVAHALVLPAHRTPPVSPLYSPSAPSYEAMDCDNHCQQQQVLMPSAPIALLPPAPFGIAPAIPSIVAKQLAFQGDGASMGDDCMVIHPTKVLCPPPENYLALAFKGKAGAPSSPMALAPATGGTAVAKDDQVRREDVLTEYSF